MRWIAFVLLLLIPTTVSAETNKRNLWIALGLMPVAFFHETTLHEAAHVVVAKAAVPGLEVTRFAPYPCHDSEGKFHFGCFASTYPDNVRVSDNAHIAISVAPYVLGASAFIVSDILLSTGAVKPSEPGGAVLYMLGMFAPFVEFAANFVLNRTDWQNIRGRSKGIAFDVVGGAMLVVGTYRLVKQGYAVFHK